MTQRAAAAEADITARQQKMDEARLTKEMAALKKDTEVLVGHVCVEGLCVGYVRV